MSLSSDSDELGSIPESNWSEKIFEIFKDNSSRQNFEVVWFDENFLDNNQSTKVVKKLKDKGFRMSVYFQTSDLVKFIES